MPEPSSTTASGPGAKARIRQRIGDPGAHVRRQRTITWILLAAIGMLLVNAIVGENGYLATVQARQEEAALAQAVTRLRQQNQLLLEERERLEHDEAAIEEAARRELGMIRPGEAVVIVREAPEAALSPAP